MVIPTLSKKTPMGRDKRKWFYDDVSRSVVDAFAAGKTRTRVKIEVPETNMEGDVYRVGTLLEMIREIATNLAVDGAQVRICVQGSMGVGMRPALPLSLSGVKRLMELMDWGDAEPFVKVGSINKETPQPDDAAFILVAPQNIVGFSVLPYMQEMMEVVGDRPVVIMNGKLGDVQSAGDVMSIRGRGERMKYAERWEEIHHFRLLYVTSYFFLIGALRKPFGGDWELYKVTGLPENAKYELTGCYLQEPNSDRITQVILSN
jgi:adenylate kinase